MGKDKLTMPCCMIATEAKHMTGDLSRNEEDICYVQEEKDDKYIGNWVTGMGFFNVEFPKKTTRKLTKKEIERYNKVYVQVANHPAHKLEVGYE